MASGTIELNTGSTSSKNCLDAYVQWSSTRTSGSNHTITFKLYAARVDWTGATSAYYTATNNNGSWSSSPYDATGTSAVFQNKTSIHLCTRTLNVTSDSSGVVSLNLYFEAHFTSSSSGLRQVSTTITSLTLDKPPVSVVLASCPSGISCSWSGSSGSNIYVGDTLTVTLNITGSQWKSASFTITGATLSSGTSGVSGSKYKVTGSVRITVTGVYNTYKLSVSANTGVTVTVYDDLAGGTYENGDYIQYGTSITVECTIASGYELKSLTINGTSYQNGIGLDVTSAINIVATAGPLGLVYIFNGSSYDAYQIYIFDGTSWNMYCPYVFDSGKWNMCA